MPQSLDGTKTAVALPHCSESTKESIAGWCIFGSELWLELWQNDGMSYNKNTQVEVLPVVVLGKKMTKYHFFVGGAIQVLGESFPVVKVSCGTPVTRGRCLGNP